jgi:hypothetical protein
MIIEDFHQNKQVLEFLELIEKYCQIIDKRNEIELNDFSNTIVPLLRRILVLIEELPDVSMFIDDEYMSSIVEEYEKERAKEFPSYLGFPTYVSNDEWWKIFSELRKKFGKYDRHDNCNEDEFSQYKKYNLLLSGSLSDDLADIYRDLKGTIILYDVKRPELLLHAIFDWKEVKIDHLISHLCGAICGISKIQ